MVNEFMKIKFFKKLVFGLVVFVCIFGFTASCWSLDTSVLRKKNDAIKNSVDDSIIVRRNLFNALPEVSSEITEIEPEVLEVPQLDIVLMGTILGGEDVSRAIILDKEGWTQDLYQVGDYVKGALIKRITRKNIVLEYEGKDKRLNMNEAFKYAPKTATRQVVTSSAAEKTKPVKRVRNVPIRRITTSSNGGEG